MRIEESSPASDDPTADSISPPVSVAGQRAAVLMMELHRPAPSLDDETDKIARLDHHQAFHHASD